MLERSEQYDLLQGLGCSARLAEAVDRLYQDSIVTQLSDQVIDNLKSLPEGVALQAIQKLRVSDLSTVVNRSAFFLGIIRSFKSQSVAAAAVGAGTPTDPNYPGSFGDTTAGGGTAAPGASTSPGLEYPGQVTILKRPPPSKNAPDAGKLKEILTRTGYSHEVTPTLRRYGGPPPNWTGPKPGPGTEVFVGRVPQDVFEDDLIPLFEGAGNIYELRVIIDNDGYNRGYGFVTFCDKEAAKSAVKQYNRHEIKPNRRLVVKLSVQFTRLYIGGIPKTKSRDDVFAAFSKEVDKLQGVILQEPGVAAAAEVKNKGFCFLEFETYFDAAAARKKLLNGRQKISAWDNYGRFVVDWAIPLENPDEEVAANSTVILVNNLSESVTNDDLVAKFQRYGQIKKVNKKNHYAFITFEERAAAVAAEKGENHQLVKDCQMDVMIHVPLSGVAKRMVQTIKGGGVGGAPPPRSAGMQMMRGGAAGGGYQQHPGGYQQHPQRGGASFRGAPRGVPRRAGTFTKSRIISRGGMMGYDNGGMYDGAFSMPPSGYGNGGATFNRF